MVSSAVRVSFRVVFVLSLLLAAFYVGRPLYWKISATFHEIREKRQTVRQGISQIVYEAQRTVGWFHDESDPEDSEDESGRKVGVVSTRRILQLVDLKRSR